MNNNNNLFLTNPAVLTWRSLYKRQWGCQRILDRFFLAWIQVNCSQDFVPSLSFKHWVLCQVGGDVSPQEDTPDELSGGTEVLNST